MIEPKIGIKFMIKARKAHTMLKSIFRIQVIRKTSSPVQREIKNLTIINFIKRIDYAIRYADIKKIEDNFFKVFHTEYDSYYLTPKSFIILMLNVLEKNRS